MTELPAWVRDALAGVYDPCCQEKGISVLDMGRSSNSSLLGITADVP